jgi:hypothetical protein
MLDWLKVLRDIGIDSVDSKGNLPALEAIIKSKDDIDLLAHEKELEQYYEVAYSNDKETLRAAERGDKVLVVNDTYGINTSQLSAVFANNNINFRLDHEIGANGSANFPVVEHFGVYFTDITTLAISRDLPEYGTLYQQLKNFTKLKKPYFLKSRIMTVQ